MNNKWLDHVKDEIDNMAWVLIAVAILLVGHYTGMPKEAYMPLVGVCVVKVSGGKKNGNGGPG